MSINVEVIKTGNENNVNLLRRFTRRVQGSGVLPRVRSKRYALRKPSEYVKKKKTLKTLIKQKYVREQIKLGKMQDTSNRRGKK